MAWWILYYMLEVLKWLVIVRAVLSWFVSSGSANPLVHLIRRITDPILRPISELLPQTGGIDLSPIVAFFAIVLLQQVILRIA